MGNYVEKSHSFLFPKNDGLGHWRLCVSIDVVFQKPQLAPMANVTKHDGNTPWLKIKQKAHVKTIAFSFITGCNLK